jgi:urease accessory protein
MLLIEKRCDTSTAATERLVLPFELRQKSRLRTRLASGEEAALFLERGAVLRGGDRLLAADGRVIEVVAAPERLLVVHAKDRRELARAAYHLGNRHIPVEVGADILKLEYDHVLQEMLNGLGVETTEASGPFEPEAGAYGGGHRHHGDDDNASGDPETTNIAELMALKRARW